MLKGLVIKILNYAESIDIKLAEFFYKIILLTKEGYDFLLKNISSIKILSLFFLMILLLFLVIKRKVQDRKKKGMRNKGIDAALDNPEYDCLRRDKFAQKIFDLIDATKKETHLRIGILGDWGSGKTTVMNFIKFYCQEKKYPIASFNPWQFHSREAAWQGFISSVDKGISRWSKSFSVCSKCRKFFKFFLGRVKDIGYIADTKIGKTIGALLLSPLENKLMETKAQLENDLKKALKNKKLYVFIDDLDRAKPEIIYEILMLLNEVFDINQCIFVIGLDPKTVSDILKDKLGFINSRDFLDKIINWKFDLPSPINSDWEYFLEREIKENSIAIKKDVLKSILEVFPKNPRKFKHYIRYLNSLHISFLNRFNDDELNWKLLYLSQLLRMEFPDIFIKLFQKEENIKELAEGVLTDEMERKTSLALDEEEKKEEPKWVKKIKVFLDKLEDVEKERFIKIYEKMRNCCDYYEISRVRNHLMVVEDPELMSWKEYREFKEKIIDDIDIQEKIKDFFQDCLDKRKIERAREFACMLIRDREEQFSIIIDLSSEEEMKIKIGELNKEMSLLHIVLKKICVFKDREPLFDENTFKEWISYLSKWTYFKDSMYKSIREDEKKIIIALIEGNLFQAENIDQWMREIFSDELYSEPEKVFQNIHKEINDILYKKLSQNILQRFEKNYGIKELRGKNKFLSEKNLLLGGDSIFHNKSNYDKLSIIAKKSESDLSIQKNFFECLRLLVYGATNHMGYKKIEPSKIKKVIENKEFFKIIWESALCKPLNIRFVNSLEKDIGKLEKEVGSKNVFKRPQWWKVLLDNKKMTGETNGGS